MSAIADAPEGPVPPVQVLFALHDGFDLLDVTGTLEVFSAALHDIKDPSTKAFKCEIVAETDHVLSAQGASFQSHLDYDDATEDLDDYDILVIPGGNEAKYIDKQEAPSIKLARAFAALQMKDPSKERTLVGLSGGAMLLGHAGLLQGMGATTHPDLFTKFEITCQRAAQRGELEATESFEERYVVNNARFALGDDMEENPFIFKRRPDRQDRKAARKGSISWQASNRRRESALQRAQMKMGGLRVVTSGGGTATFDASLYLVSAMVSHASAEEVARQLQYQWQKGVVVDSIDV